MISAKNHNILFAFQAHIIRQWVPRNRLFKIIIILVVDVNWLYFVKVIVKLTEKKLLIIKKIIIIIYLIYYIPYLLLLHRIAFIIAVINKLWNIAKIFQPMQTFLYLIVPWRQDSRRTRRKHKRSIYWANKSAIAAIRKTSERPDNKAIFNYFTSKYASNTTESTITDYITTLILQNVLINKLTLKGDSYFVIGENR